MKARKTMKNQQLIQEVISQISQRFSPRIPDIKKVRNVLTAIIETSSCSSLGHRPSSGEGVHRTCRWNTRYLRICRVRPPLLPFLCCHPRACRIFHLSVDMDVVAIVYFQFISSQTNGCRRPQPLSRAHNRWHISNVFQTSEYCFYKQNMIHDPPTFQTKPNV